MQCTACGATPQIQKTRKNGTDALPFRWIQTPQGPLCRACKPAMPTRNYAYGARPPTARRDQVGEQMWLAHRYYNDLVTLEQERRGRLHRLRLEHDSELAVIVHKLTSVQEQSALLRTRIRQRNAQAQSRTATEQDRAQLAGLHTAEQALWHEAKARLRLLQAHPAFREATAALNAWHLAESKRLRAQCGCYHGTYLVVERAVQAAITRVPTFVRALAGQPRLPWRKRWEGHGHLAVQLQKGLSLQRLLEGQDTRVQLQRREALPRTGHNLHAVPRADSRRQRVAHGRYWTLKFRLGSDAARQPLFAAIPLVLDRLPPADTVVKWVHVLRQRLGTQERWQVVLAVEAPSFATRADWPASGTVGLDVGWRLKPDGTLRVAYWHGDQGEEDHGELLLPASILARQQQCETLQSRRDLLYDEARALLHAWIQEHPACPAWLTDATATLARWRSPERLHRLLRQWRQKRFIGDEKIMAWLEGWKVSRRHEKGGYEGWALQDQHLADWIAFQRRQYLRHRNDLYRQFAAQIARKAQTVHVEDLDLAGDLLRRPEPEDATDPGHGLRGLARLAAVATLTRYLEERCATLVRREAANTTRSCSWCGHLNTFADPAVLHQRCAGCERLWDQDHNAARNLLYGLPEPANTTGAVEQPEGARRQKRRKNKGDDEPATAESLPEGLERAGARA